MLKDKTVKTNVVVREIVPGDPPTLAFSKVFRRDDGKEKTHFQRVKIVQSDVLCRLFDEVRPGDEIEVVLTTEWSTPGIPTYLTDFRARNRGQVTSEGKTPVSDQLA